MSGQGVAGGGQGRNGVTSLTGEDFERAAETSPEMWERSERRGVVNRWMMVKGWRDGGMSAGYKGVAKYLEEGYGLMLRLLREAAAEERKAEEAGQQRDEIERLRTRVKEGNERERGWAQERATLVGDRAKFERGMQRAEEAQRAVTAESDAERADWQGKFHRLQGEVARLQGEVWDAQAGRVQVEMHERVANLEGWLRGTAKRVRELAATTEVAMRVAGLEDE